MNIRLLTILVVIISLFVPSISADEQTSNAESSFFHYLNGFTWKTFSKGEKKAFLLGLSECKQIFELLAIDESTSNSSSADITIRFYWIELLNLYSLDDTIKEIDSFYINKENSPISFMAAAKYIVKKNKGASKKESDKMLYDLNPQGDGPR